MRVFGSPFKRMDERISQLLANLRIGRLAASWHLAWLPVSRVTGQVP